MLKNIIRARVAYTMPHGTDESSKPRSKSRSKCDKLNKSRSKPQGSSKGPKSDEDQSKLFPYSRSRKNVQEESPPLSNSPQMKLPDCNGNFVNRGAPRSKAIFINNPFEDPPDVADKKSLKRGNNSSAEELAILDSLTEEEISQNPFIDDLKISRSRSRNKSGIVDQEARSSRDKDADAGQNNNPTGRKRSRSPKKKSAEATEENVPVQRSRSSKSDDGKSKSLRKEDAGAVEKDIRVEHALNCLKKKDADRVEEKRSKDDTDAEGEIEVAKGETPILSREGSTIRIVDSETGEIFFRKRSRPNLSVSESKAEVFDEESSLKSCKQEALKSKVSHHRNRSPSKASQQQRTPENIIKGKWNDDNNNNEDETEESIPSKLIPGSKVRDENPRGGILKQRSIRFKNERSTTSLGSGRSETKSKSRSQTSEQDEEGSERGGRVTRSRSKTSQQRRSGSSRQRDGRLGHERATLIPDAIFEKIFNCLEGKDLEITSRVCRRWKKLTDPRLRGPLLFQGKSPYGHFYPKKNCKKFLNFLQELEGQFYRPFEMRLVNVEDSQASVLCRKLGNEFRSSVRHMVSLHLNKAQLKWSTLILLLQSFTSLRTFIDAEGDHYTKEGLCITTSTRQNWKKEVKRKEFTDFKYQLKSLQVVRLTRTSVTSELVILLNILTQGARNIQDFELKIIPERRDVTRSPAQETEFLGTLTLFIQSLNLFLFKNSPKLRKLKFSWFDEANFSGYFSKCLDALDNVRMGKLTDLTLEFDPVSLKCPRNLMKFREFMEHHCKKCLREVTISKIMLGESWFQTMNFLDELTAHELFSTRLNFELVITDAFGLQAAASTMKTLRLNVFQDSLTKMHVRIESDKTECLSQLIGMRRKDIYPRTKSFLLTFDPVARQRYKNFKEFSVEIIAFNYPNLTELRISDRLLEHEEMFNRILGRKLRVNVSRANLSNSDLQLITGNLVKLKVIKLWVDMSKVNDHGVTGIHPGDINILTEDDVNYSWNNFGYEIGPSFSTLKDLEEVSLRGLGPKVTDISAKFGFENLDRLKSLELIGNFTIGRAGRRSLRQKLKSIGTKIRLKRTLS